MLLYIWRVINSIFLAVKVLTWLQNSFKILTSQVTSGKLSYIHCWDNFYEKLCKWQSTLWMLLTLGDVIHNPFYKLINLKEHLPCGNWCPERIRQSSRQHSQSFKLIYWTKKYVGMMITLCSNKEPFPPNIKRTSTSFLGHLPSRGIWDELCKHRGCCREWVLKIEGRRWERWEISKLEQYKWPETIWGGLWDPECPTSCTDSPRSQHDICFHFLDIALHSTTRVSEKTFDEDDERKWYFTSSFCKKKIPWKPRRSFQRLFWEKAVITDLQGSIHH